MQTPIEGNCDARFVQVRDAFRENFARHGEIGAAVALTVDGHEVVNLWGGYRSPSRSEPWQRDTIVNAFSIGKAVATLAVLDRIERGELALDAPLARYWPELAAGGKHTITLRHVLSHRAGLPAIREPLPPGAGLDQQMIAGALARQTPWWEPGTAHGYHANTFGYLLNEVVRRASGTTIGRVIAERIARPLELDMYLGLPESEFARVAEFSLPPGPPWTPEPASDLELMRRNAYENPVDVSGRGMLHTRAWRTAELPSANLHASAASIARLYAALAAGGELVSRRVVAAELLREATREHSKGHDLVLNRPSRFALGFQLTQPERPLGPNADAFGHFGAGGSLGFCDPQARLGFGYVMNDLGPRWQNPRNRALIDSVYASL